MCALIMHTSAYRLGIQYAVAEWLPSIRDADMGCGISGTAASTQSQFRLAVLP